MTRTTYRWIAAGAGLMVTVLVIAALGVTAPAHAADEMLLPDLRQAPIGCEAGYDGDPGRCTDWDVCPVADATKPNGECVSSGPIRAVRLRFTSSEENIGAAPLLLYGHRDGAGSNTMSVRQALPTSAHGPLPGSYSAAQHPTSASVYYEPAAMHQHWHLLGFDRFQLRTQDGTALVADRKNGFCLGDRYSIANENDYADGPRAGSSDGRLADYLVENTCKRHDPAATDVTEGISVGQGDNYNYTVDYQWLDVTGVASGTYTVVNTVNPDHTLLESDFANNSSSIAISLQWPGGATPPSVITEAPVVTLLRSCPGSDRCPAPRR